MSDRLVTPARAPDDVQYEAGLRPRTLDDYIGQDRVRANLQVSIAAARGRGEALDHVLLYGPPGLGKTTLAYVIGNELGVPVRATAGPVLERPGDLAAILTNLGEREVLCVSQFTLYGDARKGNRPSYTGAAPPAIAEPLYQRFVALVAQELGQPVPTGIFGADMQVRLLNDGPVTIILDSPTASS